MSVFQLEGARDRLGTRVLDTARLRARQALHIAQIRLLQPHRMLGPDIGDVEQFLERKRIDAHAYVADTTMHGVVAAMVRDVVAHCLLPTSVLGQDVDEAHVIKLRGAVDAAAEDHFLGARRVELARQKAEGAHAGKQVEQDLGQAKLSVFFRHEHVEGQCAFEPAAKCIALDERDRDERQVEADRHVIGDVDAVMRIVAQRFEVACPNALDEKAEVTAEIVDARNARAADEVFDRCSLTRPQVGEHALQCPPHGN